MKISISVASAAIVAACLFSTGVSASSVPAREPVSVRVSFAGLDMSTETGRTRFQRRMASAISSACAPRIAGLQGLSDSQQCRQEMTADASTQLAKMSGRDGTQLASVGAGR